MQLDYSRFKQEINLTQYAAHLGYEVDRKKSTRSSIAMRSGADKVIISRRGAIWVYFSVSDDQDNGTIIEFAQNRTNKTIFEIGKELNSWLNGGATLPEPKSYVADVTEQEYDPERIKRIFGRCRPVTEQDYIESRGVTRALLSLQRFTGRIFLDRYQNAVFPHYNVKGICGLEFKNIDACYFARGSEKTLWRSNRKAEDDTLIISEAVLDGLSYHQIFNNEKALYAATGGGMSPEQAGLIRDFAQNWDSLKKIILITDNDQGGDKLTARVLAAIGEGTFSGEVIRHSPERQGEDWNDVLTASQP